MLAPIALTTAFLLALGQGAAPATPPTLTSSAAPAVAPPDEIAQTGASPPAASAPATVRKRLLVLDFRNDGVEDRTVLIIRDALTTNLARNVSLDVVSTEDVRRSLDVEAAKTARGCDTQTCMAEIASALGADYIVFGNIGSLGGLLVGDVSLVEVTSGRSLGRESFEVRSAEDLPAGIRTAGSRLVTMAGILREQPSGPSPLFVAGAGVTALGVASLGVGAVFASSSYGVIRDKVSVDTAKDRAEGDFMLYTAMWVSGAALTTAGVGLIFFSTME